MVLIDTVLFLTSKIFFQLDIAAKFTGNEHMEKIIIIGSDHAGFHMKQTVAEYLMLNNWKFEDCGCYEVNSVDYPDYARAVVMKVLDNSAALGILLCGSGIGVCITANRFKGIRAALCWNVEIAKLSRQHNDANVLCLPSRFLTDKEMKEIVSVFLNTDFEGGRHTNRIRKIDND